MSGNPTADGSGPGGRLEPHYDRSSVTGLIVSSYPVYAQSPDRADAVVTALTGHPDVVGLEVPWTQGKVMVPDATPDGTKLVITAIPHTMATMAADPQCGLASPDAGGRQRALAQWRDLRARVAALVDRFDVAGVEVHSAPRGADRESFLASVAELASWDWCGAPLIIEHCDAAQPNFPVEKGFLDFRDELEIATRPWPTPVRLGVNWARSVLETRRADTALEHVRLARDVDALGAVFFSSVSPVETEFGYPWIDAHLPMQGVLGAPAGTLLDDEAIRDCLVAADGQGLLGVKVGVAGGVSERDSISRVLSAVDKVSALRG